MTDRLLAVERLLDLPDPHELRSAIAGRGHRLTVPGKFDRLQTFWLHCAQTWCQHRISQAMGAADSWKPAEIQRRQPVKLQRVG